MLKRFIASTRYMVIVAVLGSFIGSIILFVVGALQTFHALADLFNGLGDFQKLGKILVVDFIEIVDVFLLATVLYLIALGLFELFIDDTIPVPKWAEIHDLEDLKEKLLAGVVVVLAVFFLSQAFSWDGSRDLLGIGAAVALVIGSLTWFLSQKTRKKLPTNKENNESPEV